MEYVMPLVNALKVALGLGFVIFIHELGHFLLAKWNGVKVETFSIGLGPTLASFRPGAGFRLGAGIPAPAEGEATGVGETEYVLAAIPLGGYVKMLGEGIVEGVSGKTSDPRAYQNKSVWGRMGIISAGVIMNLILGILCFAYAFGQGVMEMPAKAGAIVAGSPAYEAGFRAGDEIVAVDGRRGISFGQMAHKVNLSGHGQKLKMEVRRDGVPDTFLIEVEPRNGRNRDVPTIGVAPAVSLDLVPSKPYVAPNGVTDAPKEPIAPGGLTDEVRVVAVGPADGPLEPVRNYEEWTRQLDKLRAVPVVVEVERVTVRPDGTKTEPERKRSAPLPPHPVVDLGMRLTAGPIVAVQANSIAQKAGLRAGDRIVAVGGAEDFDPMRLPDLVRESAGTPLTLQVERGDSKAGGTRERVDVTVTPDGTPVGAEPADVGEPLDVPGLGFAFAVEPKVRSVREGSPAAKAGIKPGDALDSITITPKASGGRAAKPQAIPLNEDRPAWVSAFLFLQEDAWDSVQIRVAKADKPVTVRPEPDPTWFRLERGLRFQVEIRKLPPQGLVASIRSGAEEAYDSVVGIFGMFRGLAQRRVGTKAMGGLPRIAQIAYQSASAGITPFVQFLGMLSVNLAVLNFLPIPPLDGGQMVFLIAEKIRGRPLPEAATNIGMLAGIVFVVGLILFINLQDVYLLAKDYFS